ncbi:DNA polymerase III subunit gamma/tau [bacterium 3DAC]|nr:DNA polymerase III subunit gamma/tau [Dictyoglomota bacterium]UZN23347.1 DNA polymerase III subunit gamma/tau [bacterium 3DAC]
MALYRKYRPQTFDEVVGQEAVVSILKKALDSGNISHAYLFAGPRGTGKTSIARILAKGLNCEKGVTSQPCGTCYMCRAITEGRAVDVIEIDAASNRGIDDIREIRERVKHPPLEGRYKVYIIDEVHMLTKEAFNALLKTLEEPPEYVVFVLATTDPHKLPETILSRVQRFNFHKLSIDDSVLLLQRVCDGEGFECEKEALILIARYSDGAMRDALNLLEQVSLVGDGKITLEAVKRVIGGVSAERVLEFFRALEKGDTSAVFAVLDNVLDEGTDPVLFHRTLFEYISYAIDYAVDRSSAEKLGLLEVEKDILDILAKLGIDVLSEMSKQMIELERYYRYTDRHKSSVLKMVTVKLMAFWNVSSEGSEESSKVMIKPSARKESVKKAPQRSATNLPAALSETAKQVADKKKLAGSKEVPDNKGTTDNSVHSSNIDKEAEDIVSIYKKKAPKTVEEKPKSEPKKEEKKPVDEAYKLLAAHYPEWALMYYKVGRLDGNKLYFSTTYAKDLFETAINKFGWKEKLLEVLKPLGVTDVVVEEKGASEPYVPASEEEAMKILEEIFHV